jgi:putative membrane protein
MGDGLTAPRLAKLVAVTNLYEIEAGKVALERSWREDIKSFARGMIEDHSRMQRELKSRLSRENTPGAPEQLDKAHQLLIDDLKSAADDNFDGRYISQQEQAHISAIALLNGYNRLGDDEAMKELCTVALPIIEHHLRMAHGLTGA